MLLRHPSTAARLCRGLSLCEVVISLALTSLSVAALIDGYVVCARQAETSALHLAAQAQALERLEQIRAAKWDPYADPPVDQIWTTNFPAVVRVLDVPSRSAERWATNFTTVQVISTTPALKAVRIATVWGANGKLYTNSITTYRGPDQ
jgi:Tfp pilus assembly protein PilV